MVHNKDGKVDIISRYAGDFEYGRGNSGDKGYDSSVSNDKSHPIPPAHRIVLRLSKDDPYFDEIVDLIKNFPPFQNDGTRPEVIIEIDTDPTAEDVDLISPEA